MRTATTYRFTNRYTSQGYVTAMAMAAATMRLALGHFRVSL